LSQSRVKVAAAAVAAPALGRLPLATATHRGRWGHAMVGKEEKQGRQEDATAGVRLRTEKASFCKGTEKGRENNGFTLK